LVEDEVWKVFDLLTEAKLISPKEPYQVTPFGRRVSELYLDPLSARVIKLGLENGADRSEVDPLVYLQLVCSTPDIRNYSVRQKDMPKLITISEQYQDLWLDVNLEEYEEFEVDIFYATLKIAYVIQMWLDEASEEQIYIEMGVSSGDLHSILERTKWLIHCAAEISKIFKWENHKKILRLLDQRLKYGVTEELLKLVDIRGIGRIRARTLYDAGFKTIEQIKQAPLSSLSDLPGFGERIAQNIKMVLNGEQDANLLDGDDIITSDQSSNDQSSLTNFFD
jgi:helicase